MVVKMIFVPGPIFGIVDDIIPDGTRCGRGDRRVAPTSFVPVIIDNYCVAKRKRCKYRYFGETIL